MRRGKPIRPGESGVQQRIRIALADMPYGSIAHFDLSGDMDYASIAGNLERLRDVLKTVSADHERDIDQLSRVYRSRCSKCGGVLDDRTCGSCLSVEVARG